MIILYGKDLTRNWFKHTGHGSNIFQINSNSAIEENEWLRDVITSSLFISFQKLFNVQRTTKAVICDIKYCLSSLRVTQRTFTSCRIPPLPSNPSILLHLCQPLIPLCLPPHPHYSTSPPSSDNSDNSVIPSWPGYMPCNLTTSGHLCAGVYLFVSTICVFNVYAMCVCVCSCVL